MNKKIIFMILGVLMLIAIISFAVAWFTSRNNTDPGTGTNTGNTPSTGTKVTLTYWGLWEDETVMAPLIQKYELANPNINIEYTKRPFTQYDSIAYTRIVQGSTTGQPAPDILRIHNTWLTKYQPYLSTAPSSVMNISQYKTDFYPTAAKDFTDTAGNIYAIPLEIDGLALFYNKKLFAEAGITTPPQDWDTLIEDAKKLTKTDAAGNITQAGIAMGTSKNVIHSADILSLILLQNSVEPIGTDIKTVTLDTPRAKTALDFYTSFSKEHKVWSPDLRSDLEVFYSGKLAMMLAPSWRAFDIINAAPNVEFDLAPAPQVPGATPVNYSMYWGEAVPKNSPNATEAWKFVKFLSEQQQMKEFYAEQSKIRAFGEPYSRKDLATELQGKPYVGAIMEMAPTMRAWFMGEQGFVEETLRTAINDVAEGGVDSTTALKDAEERINNKLQEVIQ